MTLKQMLANFKEKNNIKCKRLLKNYTATSQDEKNIFLNSILLEEETLSCIGNIIQQADFQRELEKKIETLLNGLHTEQQKKYLLKLLQNIFLRISKGDRNQKVNLLSHIVQEPLPEEVVPLLVDNLISNKLLYKDQRIELQKHILSASMTCEQIEQCVDILPTAIVQSGYQKYETMLEQIRAYEDAVRKLAPWVDTQRTTWKEQSAAGLLKVIEQNVPFEDVLLDIICEGNLCYLKDACIEFIDRKQLWLMMQELLFTEEYYCKFETDNPYILDCGVNIGLAIYYYKHYYPNAEVVGFEPWTVAYECARRNIARNNWSNVTLIHSALDAQTCEMKLEVLSENSLACSLTNRLEKVAQQKNWKVETEDVVTCRLSNYIDRPVDFLKMDIEGVENRVLDEARYKLPLVKRLFVEYHYAETLADNSISDILKILDEAGFTYQIARSQSYEQQNHWRPFRKVGGIVSELIWAVRE